MKPPRFPRFLSFWLLALVLMLSGAVPSAFAQENPSASAVVIPAPVPVAPVPAVEAPKVTARKPEEEETEVNPAAAAPAPAAPIAGAEQHAKTMNMLQAAAASVFRIPTETTQAAEVARLSGEVATLTAARDGALGQVADLQGQLATAQAENARLTAQYNELSGALADLTTQPPSALLAANPENLSPTQQQVQQVVATAVASEIRGVGVPAANLPGPGAAPTQPAAGAPDTLDPVAKEEQRRAFFFQHTQNRMPKGDN